MAMHEAKRAQVKEEEEPPAVDDDQWLRAPDWQQIKNPAMMARLLYCNPVCLLCTTSSSPTSWNCMVITWLTCADNVGGIICSVNKKRFSAQALLNPPEQDQQQPVTFTLAIPTKPMEATVLAIGSCSGRDGDKRALLGLSTTRYHANFPPALHSEHVAAVLGCTVLRIDPQGVADDAHLTVFAKITVAHVRSTHWQANKWFTGAPRLLSFMGTKRFATMDGGDDDDN